MQPVCYNSRSICSVVSRPAALTPSTGPHKKNIPNYRNTFLPFNLSTYASLASPNFFFSPDLDLQPELESSLDLLFAAKLNESPALPFGPPISRGHQVIPLMKLLREMAGSEGNPIDLTRELFSKRRTSHAPKSPAMKYIHFHQDVRPPYCGTYTRALFPKDRRTLARNPCRRYKATALDYDYDSEAEWDEEEGEDILSEGDDDAQSDEEMDEFADFIDDGDAPDSANFKRIGMVDAKVCCSGIQWEDGKGVLHPADPQNEKVNWTDLELGVLLSKTDLPSSPAAFWLTSPASRDVIDPYSTKYWTAEKSSRQGATIAGKDGFAQPHRPALAEKTAKMNSLAQVSASAAAATITSGAPQAFKVQRQIPQQDLDAFKAAINGQDLTKLAMIEYLKKQYAASSFLLVICSNSS
jgi:chromatin assembly factor 1 subunit A